MEVPSVTAPDCRRCVHYYITHDASFLYGCRSLNFKSRQLPMYAVLEASGQACLAFTPKKPASAGPRTG